MLNNGDELLRLTEVRDGVGIDRDLGSARKGIKYDYEVVPAGARFDVCIVLENAEEWEIGLLLLSLKAMEQGELPIGGKTTRGLGWGKLIDLKVQQVDKSTLLTYLQCSGAQTFEPSRFIDAFVKALK
jgi:CRISPR-associated RAMP protein (TIGR02581 family)